MIEFGRDANQIFHTFRHVEEAALNRNDVEHAIREQLLAIESSLRPGLYIGRMQVKGADLEYRAYKFPSGNINVGRITVS